jgi:hypothetical protein
MSAAQEDGDRPPPVVRAPVRLAVIRVQGPGYRSAASEGTNCGRYCAVAGADSAQPVLKALSGWPSVGSAVALDAGLLPSHLDSLTDLRWAAAKLQADVMFVYTLDTKFVVGGHALEPGARLPSARPAGDAGRIDCLASGQFFDVRTGAGLGQAHGTASRGLDDAWGSISRLEDGRLQTEDAAVASLLGDARSVWTRLAQGG